MDCPHCQAAAAETARFCSSCGHDFRWTDLRRGQSFAANPDQAVASFALVSTLMPRGVGRQVRTYQLAFAMAFLVAALAAVVGATPVALVVAAVAIPVVYLGYVDDVDLWEGRALLVTVLACLVPAVLSFAATTLWTQAVPLPLTFDGISGHLDMDLRRLVVLALLVPVISELLKQLGPLFLATRPRFDDIGYGLAFGVLAGVSYAAVETLVTHWPVVTGGGQGTNDPALWLSLVVAEGVVKPLLYGAATGLACSRIAGHGVTPRYALAVLLAMTANALYHGGGYLVNLIGRQPLGQILGIVWGMLLVGLLLLRLRRALHHGFMAPPVRAAWSATPARATPGACPHCDALLASAAAFCPACGTSLRSKGIGLDRPEPAAPSGRPT